MIKSLSFHNWRSLKDVTIDDLTPITVFIGANSFGKTNIVDALKFRQAIASGNNWKMWNAVRQFGGINKIITQNTTDAHFSIQFTFQTFPARPLFTTRTTFERDDSLENPLGYHHMIQEGDHISRFMQSISREANCHCSCKPLLQPYRRLHCRAVRSGHERSTPETS